MSIATRRHLMLSQAVRNVFGGHSFNFHPEGVATPPATKPDPIKTLREEFAAKKAEAEAVVKKAVDESRDLSAEEKTANDARFARCDAIKKIIDERTRFASLAIAGDPDASGEVETPAEPPGKGEFKASRELEPESAEFKREFSKAMSQWAATGEMPRKFATITTSTSSNAILPRQIALPEVISTGNVYREAFSLLGTRPLFTTGTNALKVPILGMTSAGAAVAENASSETTNDPTLSDTIDLNPSTYQSGSGYFSNLSLAANDFDLVGYVQTDLLDAKEQGFESAITAAIIADTNVTQVETSSTTTGFTYDNLVNLTQKPSKYFSKQTFILLGQAAYSAAIKLVGDDGHPILIPDVQNGSLMRFLGIPVLRCDYLEGLTANKTVGLLISVRGFRIRDCGQQILQRYNQVPAKPNQTGFNLFGYHAYGYTVKGIAKLKTAVS